MKNRFYYLEQQKGAGQNHNLKSQMVLFNQ